VGDPAEERSFKLVGGRLCLDFVNTVGNYLDPARRRDYLTGYGDLLAWGRQAGAIDETAAARLRREAAARPDEAAAALARAGALRDAIHDVAVAVAHGDAVDPAALDRLNGFVGELLGGSRLVATGEGFALERADEPGALDRVLWPVVRSAIDLFTSGEVARVRECGGEACGWVFVDTSRGGRRRWCDMADCGNTAKVRRFRARRAGSAA
jgi:predicted RNA-binding Zn ribbon-like protein